MSDGFKNLWPTTLLDRQLPGAESANVALAVLIRELEQQHREKTQQANEENQSNLAKSSNITTDYLSQDFFSHQHPAVQWLVSCVNKSASDYLRHAGVEHDISWSLQAWANINRQGDYHNIHNHPHSYLSGTYYVKVPDIKSAAGSRDDLNPNAISFYDPRTQANMNAIPGDGQVDPEHRLLPVAGQILLWPSFLMHFVHPNLGEEERISISFNVLTDSSALRTIQ